MNSPIFRKIRTAVSTAGSYMPPKVKNEVCGECNGIPPDIELLVATSNGLLEIKEKRINKILEGEFYGITRHGDSWVVFQKCGRAGRLLSIASDSTLYHGNDVKVSMSLLNLSRGVHQIDFFQDKIFIADTYNNRVLVSELKGGGNGRYRIVQSIYPAGTLDRQRQSANYVHLNSLYHHDGCMLMVFHNESKKTGKSSELCAYHVAEESVKMRRNIAAMAAHNIMPWRGDFLYCDSLGGRLVWNEEEVFAAELFLRGLSVTDDYIFVGGSEFSDRDSRRTSNGVIFALDHDYNLLNTLKISGAVHEIRCKSSFDFGMSMAQSVS